MAKKKIVVIDEDFEELKREWYSIPTIKYEMVKTMLHRETATINVIDGRRTLRCLKIGAVKYLDMNDERYDILSEPFNIYSSLAKYPMMPVFSFSRDVKKNQQNKFNDEYRDYMSEYDFLIDVDNENVGQALKSVRKVKGIFDEMNVPYWLMFSGSKGFHIRVEFKDFPDWLKKKEWDDISDFLKKFAENLRAVTGIDDIDLSVFDLRRIAKTPYSVVYPYYFIALPLSDEQLDNFNFEMVSLPILLRENLDNPTKFYNRGLLKREGSPEGFENLIKEYMGSEFQDG